MTVLYNCKHSGDQYQITKFKHGEVESSYLCDHVACTCPAGVRDTCRHRLMLPMFLEHDLINTNLFLNWDKRSITDFNGLPAVPPSHDLAPQALTDTYVQTEPAKTPEEAAAAMAVCPYWNGEKPLSEPDPPRVTPATPQWRRW